MFEHENETDCCFRSWGLAERNKYRTTTRSLVAVKEEFTSFKRLQVVQYCSHISFLGVSNRIHIPVIQTFCQRFVCSCKNFSEQWSKIFHCIAFSINYITYSFPYLLGKFLFIFHLLWLKNIADKCTADVD